MFNKLFPDDQTVKRILVIWTKRKRGNSMNQLEMCKKLRTAKSGDKFTVIFPQSNESQAIYFVGLHTAGKIILNGLGLKPATFTEHVSMALKNNASIFEFEITDDFDKDLLVPIAHLIRYLG